MKKYKHVFIDFDRTLWDFEKSTAETFREIYDIFELKTKGIQLIDEFTETYNKKNDLLWSYYRKNEITKKSLNVKRFILTLNEFKIDDQELAKQIAEYYIIHSPRKINMFPYVHEILSYLHLKYKLYLLTNGFEEVQQKKLDLGDLRKYFTSVITSEKAGVKKPDKGIFFYALGTTGAKVDESLMIGDDLRVDIDGAKTVNMDHIYVNYKKLPHNDTVTYEVNTLKEIETIL